MEQVTMHEKVWVREKKRSLSQKGPITGLGLELKLGLDKETRTRLGPGNQD